jgi:hypothetical protein
MRRYEKKPGNYYLKIQILNSDRKTDTYKKDRQTGTHVHTNTTHTLEHCLYSRHIKTYLEYLKSQR